MNIRLITVDELLDKRKTLIEMLCIVKKLSAREKLFIRNMIFKYLEI